jgi:hypothetical protein
MMEKPTYMTPVVEILNAEDLLEALGPVEVVHCTSGGGGGQPGL